MGIVVCHDWDDKHIIHSEIYDDKYTLENLKIAKKVSDAVDQAFKRKGVKVLHTWAETEQQKRYNLFLGYKPTGRIVNDGFAEKNYPREVFEYKKDLI